MAVAGDTTDLYVQLGECLWKKKPVDKEGAKLSFEQCLKSSDKEIVKLGKRNLSIVLRQIAASDGTDHEQKAVRTICLCSVSERDQNT